MFSFAHSKRWTLRENNTKRCERESTKLKKKAQIRKLSSSLYFVVCVCEFRCLLYRYKKSHKFIAYDFSMNGNSAYSGHFRDRLENIDNCRKKAFERGWGGGWKKKELLLRIRIFRLGCIYFTFEITDPTIFAKWFTPPHWVCHWECIIQVFRIGSP